WELVAQALDSTVNDDSLGLTLPKVEASTKASDLVEYLIHAVEVYGTADEVWSRHERTDEHALYLACADGDVDDGQTLVCLLAMLLLLRQRFGLPERYREYSREQDLLAAGGNLRIGMAGFMYQLNQRMLKDPGLFDLVKWLIEDFVIIQHERGATAKLPDDTVRLRHVGSALQFFDQEVPAGLLDSRFNALSTLVHELGWIGAFRESNRHLTVSGENLLTEGVAISNALEHAAAPYVAGRESLS